MKLFLAPLFFAIAVSTSAFAQDRDSCPLNPFTTDGCSMFWEGTSAEPNLWLNCCIDHDYAYWKGGTKKERRQADVKLSDCIEQKTHDPLLSNAVFAAVRFAASPYLSTSFRWGYGWSCTRDYGPLSPTELAEVAALEPQDIYSTPVQKPDTYFPLLPTSGNYCTDFVYRWLQKQGIDSQSILSVGEPFPSIHAENRYWIKLNSCEGGIQIVISGRTPLDCRVPQRAIDLPKYPISVFVSGSCKDVLR
ncbi:hypothetical protein K2X30_14650 [bacterium]|nr:hypothetical protein [bacterium]